MENKLERNTNKKDPKHFIINTTTFQDNVNEVENRIEVRVQKIYESSPVFPHTIVHINIPEYKLDNYGCA